MRVSNVRDKYMKPVSAKGKSRYDDEGYCVGGAVFLYDDPESKIHFPPMLTLAFKLKKLNRNLRSWQAKKYARKIIKLSDKSEFNKAWHELETALKA